MVSMMSYMDFVLCKRRLEEVDEVVILACRSTVGLSCRGSPAGKGKDQMRCPLSASPTEGSSAQKGLVQRVLVLSPTCTGHLRFPWRGAGPSRR